jgi:hypothetical protein
LKISFALIAFNGIGILLLTSFGKQVFDSQETTVES